MLLSCAAIFIMGATYEGVKWFRVFLQMTQTQAQVLANKSCVEVSNFIFLYVSLKNILSDLVCTSDNAVFWRHLPSIGYPLTEQQASI